MTMVNVLKKICTGVIKTNLSMLSFRATAVYQVSNICKEAEVNSEKSPIKLLSYRSKVSIVPMSAIDALPCA